MVSSIHTKLRFYFIFFVFFLFLFLSSIYCNMFIADLLRRVVVLSTINFFMDIRISNSDDKVSIRHHHLTKSSIFFY